MFARGVPITFGPMLQRINSVKWMKMSCPIMSSFKPNKMCFLVDIGFRYRIWVLSFPKGNCSCSSTQKELHGAKQNWQCWIWYCWLKKSTVPVEVGSLSQVLQGFMHPRWCRLSSINSGKRVDCRGLWFWDSYFTLLGPKLIEGILVSTTQGKSLFVQSIFVSKNRENLLLNVNGEQTCLNSTFLWLTNQARER